MMRFEVSCVGGSVFVKVFSIGITQARKLCGVLKRASCGVGNPIGLLSEWWIDFRKWFDSFVGNFCRNRCWQHSGLHGSDQTKFICELLDFVLVLTFGINPQTSDPNQKSLRCCGCEWSKVMDDGNMPWRTWPHTWGSVISTHRSPLSRMINNERFVWINNLCISEPSGFPLPRMHFLTRLTNSFYAWTLWTSLNCCWLFFQEAAG